MKNFPNFGRRRWLAIGSVLLAAASAQAGGIQSEVIFGNTASETAAVFSGTNVSAAKTNATTGATYREILPHAAGIPDTNPIPPAGLLTFTVVCDPTLQNYLTVQFWGDDANASTFFLYDSANKRQGVVGSDKPNIMVMDVSQKTDPGRYYYVTIPIEKTLTKGKTTVKLSIGCYGSHSFYAATADKENLLTANSLGVYRAVVGTDPYYIPTGQTQGPGVAPVASTPSVVSTELNTLRTSLNTLLTRSLNNQVYGSTWQAAITSGSVPAAVWGAPMASASPNQTKTATQWLDYIHDRVSDGNSIGFINMGVWAAAYVQPWSTGYRSTDLLDRVAAAIDYCCRSIGSNGGFNSTTWKGGPTRKSAGSGLEGFGVQYIMYALNTMYADLNATGRLDVLIDDDNNPATAMVSRRTAWTTMLVSSRTYLRGSPGGAVNQAMVQKLSMWQANQAVRLLDPSKALTDATLLPNIYSVTGLAVGLSSGYSFSPLGMALERYGSNGGGYEGAYGMEHCPSMLNELAELTNDSQIWAMAEKTVEASVNFLFPGVDQNGRQRLVKEGPTSYRIFEWPNEPCDFVILQQVLRNNPTARRCLQIALQQGNFPFVVPPTSNAHYLEEGAKFIRSYSQIEASVYAVATAGVEYPPLPHEASQPDFVWADPIGCAVVIRDQGSRTFFSLNWRRDFVNGVAGQNFNQVNNVASIHQETPTFDRIATVAMIGDNGVKKRYSCQWGPYYVVTNLDAVNSYPVVLPPGWSSATNLATGAKVDLWSTVDVPPSGYLVLKRDQSAVSYFGGARTTTTTSTELTGGADAVVRAGSGMTTVNYGAETTLALKYGGYTPTNTTRKLWLRFPVTHPVGQTVTSAELRFVISSALTSTAPVHTYEVYGLNDGDADENWGETTTTWDTAPANDKTLGAGVDMTRARLLGTFTTVPGSRTVGTIVRFSSDALLQQLNADTDGKVSLIVTSATNDSGTESFAAKEHATLAAPTLAITTASAPTSAVNLTSSGGSANVAFSLTGFSGTPGSYTVSATSSNGTLFPAGSIVISGTGTERNVQLTPAAGTSGTAMVTFTVSDGTTSSSYAVQVTVTPPNRAPVLGAISNQAINPGQTATIPLSVSDPDGDALTTEILSGLGALSGTASAPVYSWKAPLASAGTNQTISLRVSDTGSPALTDSKSFQITVAPVGAFSLEVLGISGGTTQLRIRGFVGPGYKIEWSDDLAIWQTLTTVTPTAFPYDFTDPTSGSTERRFYRATLVE